MAKPTQASPTIAQCLNGGLGWLKVECNRCKARAIALFDTSAIGATRIRCGNALNIQALHSRLK